MYKKDLQFYKFCLYGFLKNLRFFEPFFILFLRSKGLSFTQIGVLYAVREIITNLLEIPSGLVADSWGRKKSLLFSYILYIISYIIFAIGNGFWIFLIAIVFFGIAKAFKSGTNKAMIYYYLDVRGWSNYKVDYYGNTRSCSQLGSALSSLIAAFIVFTTDNYSSVYFYTIIPYFLGFILIASYPSWIDKGIKKNKKQISFGQVLKEFWQVIKSWKNLKQLTNLSLLESYFKALKDYIQPLIKQLALTLPFVWLATMSDKQKITIWIGIVYFIVYLLTAYASRRSSYLLKIKNDLVFWINNLLILCLILGFTSGLLEFFHFNLWAVIIFILIFIVHNFRKPLSVAYLNKIFRTEIFASGVSTQNQLKTIFTAIISLFIGILADYLSVSLAIVVVSVILLIFSLFVSIKTN